MGTKKTRTRVKNLAHGRPPTVKSALSRSSKATRALIRTHHVLEKRRAKALAVGDTTGAATVLKEIENYGGIETYQRASLLGQAKDRGGDSSKLLMEWLKPLLQSSSGGPLKKDDRLRMLEVGALSITNACSRSGIFDIERIDLNSQAEGIMQQDFMGRPLPSGPSEQFDIISLSLVLNYVPDPTARGEMLERTLRFLRKSSLSEENHHAQDSFPSLFLVLPARCVTNSRYMDEPKLEAIMTCLGYVKMQQKLSNKLAYYLWTVKDPTQKKRTNIFKKTEIRSGKTRNNFSIVLK